MLAFLASKRLIFSNKNFYHSKYLSPTQFLTHQFGLFFTKNIQMNHTRTGIQKLVDLIFFARPKEFHHLCGIQWNIKKTYFLYFHYLIYILHTSIPPKY